LEELEVISEEIRQDLSARNEARDSALQRSRELIRLCANSIRAAHREDWDAATELLKQADQVAAGLVANGLAQSMGDDDEPEVRSMKFRGFPPGTMNKSGLKRVIDYIKEGYDKGGASEMGDRFNQFLTGDIPKNITDIRDGEDEFIS